jgi:hypothetical protein
VCSNDVDTCFVAQCLRAWVSEISSGISHDEVFFKKKFWQAAESLGLTTSFLTVNVDMIAFWKMQEIELNKMWSSVIGQEGARSRVPGCQHCKCPWKQSTDFLCDVRRSNLASGEPSGWWLAASSKPPTTWPAWVSSQIYSRHLQPNPQSVPSTLASRWSCSARNLVILTSIDGPRTTHASVKAKGTMERHGRHSEENRYRWFRIQQLSLPPNRASTSTSLTPWMGHS